MISPFRAQNREKMLAFLFSKNLEVRVLTYKLQNQGIHKGENAAIFCPNCSEGRVLIFPFMAQKQEKFLARVPKFFEGQVLTYKFMGSNKEKMLPFLVQNVFEARVSVFQLRAQQQKNMLASFCPKMFRRKSSDLQIQGLKNRRRFWPFSPTFSKQ